LLLLPLLALSLEAKDDDRNEPTFEDKRDAVSCCFAGNNLDDRATTLRGWRCWKKPAVHKPVPPKKSSISIIDTKKEGQYCCFDCDFVCIKSTANNFLHFLYLGGLKTCATRVGEPARKEMQAMGMWGEPPQYAHGSWTPPQSHQSSRMYWYHSCRYQLSLDPDPRSLFQVTMTVTKEDPEIAINADDVPTVTAVAADDGGKKVSSAGSGTGPPIPPGHGRFYCNKCRAVSFFL
jgi:hypothetical protein